MAKAKNLFGDAQASMPDPYKRMLDDDDGGDDIYGQAQTARANATVAAPEPAPQPMTQGGPQPARAPSPAGSGVPLPPPPPPRSPAYMQRTRSLGAAQGEPMADNRMGMDPEMWNRQFQGPGISGAPPARGQPRPIPQALPGSPAAATPQDGGYSLYDGDATAVEPYVAAASKGIPSGTGTIKPAPREAQESVVPEGGDYGSITEGLEGVGETPQGRIPGGTPSPLEDAPSAPGLSDYDRIGDSVGELGELPDFNAPAAPEMLEGYESLWNYAQDWMDSPNPYLSDLAQATRASSEARLGAMREEGERDISEWAASRGLIGSSLEGEQMVQLTSELQRIAQDDERKFLELLVEAESEGRAQAFSNALATAQLGEEAAQFRAEYMMDAEKFGFEAAFSKVQLEQQASLDKARLSLDAAMAGDAAAMDRVRFELDRLRAMDDAILSRDELALRGQEIDQRAQALLLDRARLKLDSMIAGGAEALDRARLELDEREVDRLMRMAFGPDGVPWEQIRWQAEYDFREEQWGEDQQRYADWLELQGGDPGKKPAERPQTYGAPGSGGYDDPYASDYYNEALY